MEQPSQPAVSIDRLFPGRKFISTVLEMFDTKTQMTAGLWKIYLMRAAMAGVIIAMFYAAFYSVEAVFDEVPIGDGETLKPIGKFVASFIFGFALVFIYFSKSELLTSNMMVGSVAEYHRHTVWPYVLRLLGMCYLGNFLGGFFVAVLLTGSSLITGGTAEMMGESVAVKTGYLEAGAAGWLDLFVRAILCNFLINLAMLVVYNGMIHEDISKMAAMVAAVFLFAFLGLEHSVANTVLFLVYGMQYGVDPLLAVGNVAIALVGNMIGGGILIGVYYAYANDYRRAERKGHLPHD